MDITLFLAIWGSILSTLIAMWNIFTYFNDKGKLDIKCMFAKELGPYIDYPTVLSFTITNIGRKDIVVTSLALADKSKKYFWVTAGLSQTQIPKSLKPGEYLIENLMNFKDILSMNIKSIYAIDSLGKKHSMKRKVLNRFKLTVAEKNNELLAKN